MLALELVERLRRVSPAAANLMMTVALPRIIPMASGLGIRVEEVSETRSRSRLPLKRRTRNHVGSIYFGALMTVMEVTMGMFIFRHFPMGPYKALVNRVETDFRSKAKGTVYAVCEPPEEVLASFRDALRQSGDKVQGWMPVRLESEDGGLVAEARFLVALKRS
ncbi:PaaI family thioesterase [Archangium sp.]|jgi:acyl-coenzyme A thioesterase PaaI-like protein|uniref:PaaI family thioesterase n=1 Tax=Archangium sp. TaxID=1872627 RepID=UPI002ED886C7